MVKKKPITSEQREQINIGKIPWRADEFYEIMELIGTASAKNTIKVVTTYLQTKYRDEGDYLILAFAGRFTRMTRFLSEYEDRLTEDNMVFDDGKGLIINDELIDALCEVPYSKAIVDNGKEILVFSYNDIVTRAREIAEMTE